ncbi:MAG: lipoyl(octanoyl) transferase LipB [Gemmatimonadota bacterium]|nr:MAG: lipoyl(octanoyl) transferase LipB [Gemmatimonadota bacterium]
MDGDTQDRVASQKTCRLLRRQGLTDYGEALALQRRLANARVSGELADDILILLEHPRVITLGRGAQGANVIRSRDMLELAGVEVHEVERGGDVTYHGPGQLVGYPIVDLTHHKRDLHWYLRQLEEVLIRAIAAFGITGIRVPGYTGVWVRDRKIASIGVHVTRWVTFHGFALNVSTDLSDFDLIVPCGIEEVQMTSVEREAGRAWKLDEAAAQVARSFGEVFGLAVEPAVLTDLP